MRVCLVSQQFPPGSARGGIGTQTANKAEMLTRLGHEVHVLTAAWEEGPDLVTETVDGVTVHRLQPPDDEVVEEEAPYWLGYSWLVFRHLRGLEAEHSFDLVNFPEYGAEGYLYQLDRGPWAWTPVAVQLHGPLLHLAEGMGWPEEGSDLYRVGGHMEGESVRRADGLLASSANIADFAARRYGVERDAIGVVHSGVDLDVFTPGRGGGSDPVVLFVGNVAEQKGVVTAFEAVMRLRDRYPELRLRIVGPVNGDEVGRRMRRQAEQAGAADALEFTGFVNDRRELAAHYQAATVLCAPSQYEAGVANVYLEAMACGCPVVASDNGGTPEAITDGEEGFLVPAGDVEATAAALDRVLESAELRARLVERARARIEGYFTRELYIERVLAAYAATIERSERNLELCED